MLSKKLYTKILASVPVLTVDILVKKNKKYLLLKRTNKPLLGKYWIPGGRVLRGENIIKAAQRKLREETGLIAKSMKIVGYSNGIWKDNLYRLDFIQTVSLVFLCNKFKGNVIVDKQSSNFKWSDKLPTGCVINYI